eukprot:4285532-Amphidinium_carterae.1
MGGSVGRSHVLTHTHIHSHAALCILGLIIMLCCFGPVLLFLPHSLSLSRNSTADKSTQSEEDGKAKKTASEQAAALGAVSA